jgi:Cyclin D1 binding domain
MSVSIVYFCVVYNLTMMCFHYFLSIMIRYGDHGYELINITYTGDVLQAFKVTGHQNVPKGELSFSVDLKPSSQVALEPVVLGDNASRQWGAKYLSRYVGKGQVAGEGFINAQFVEGQLILVNDFFSFAWVPIGHQVFFGRPTPELVLKLMRESEEGKTDLDRARAHINRCMEETLNYLDLEMDELTSLAVPQEDFYNMDGYFE